MLFKLDEKNNLILKDGSPIPIDELEEKAQYIKNFLLVDISEDENGLDIQGLFAPQLNNTKRANAIVERLGQCKYFGNINSIDFTQEKDKMIINLSIKTNEEEDLNISLTEPF